MKDNDKGIVADEGRQRSRLFKRSPMLNVLLVIGMVFVAIAAFLASTEKEPRRPVQTTQSDEPTKPAPSPAPYIKNAVGPLISRMQQQNEASADEATKALHKRFAELRAGIPAFVEDTTSLTTRLGLAWRWLKDAGQSWWPDASPQRCATHIGERFETHVVSEEQLREIVQEVLEQYRYQVKANRNQLLIDAPGEIATEDIPVEASLSPEAIEAFVETLADEWHTLLDKAARHSLGVFLFSNAGGELAGYAAARLVIQAVLAATTIDLAISAAPIASSFVGGGTAVGALGGPVGVGIGVVVALAVGVGFDMWITAHLEEALTAQSETFLNSVEQRLIQGADSDEATEAWPGLKRFFSQCNARMTKTAHAALQNAVSEVAP